MAANSYGSKELCPAKGLERPSMLSYREALFGNRRWPHLPHYPPPKQAASGTPGSAETAGQIDPALAAEPTQSARGERSLRSPAKCSVQCASLSSKVSGNDDRIAGL